MHYLPIHSLTTALWQFTQLSWWKQTQHQPDIIQLSDVVAVANQIRLYAVVMSASTMPLIVITHPDNWYSFYCPTENGRLSRPRQNSKGVQPMLNDLYCSGCCEEQAHNYKSQRAVIVGALTPVRHINTGLTTFTHNMMNIGSLTKSTRM